jgi:hypothetical protein
MTHLPAVVVEEAAASAVVAEDFMAAVCVRAATGAGPLQGAPVDIGVGPLLAEPVDIGPSESPDAAMG